VRVTGRDEASSTPSISWIGIQIAVNSGMSHGTVVLVGNLPIERLVLDCLASEFGLSFQKVDNLQNSPNLNPTDDAVAVLFNANSLGLPWDEALRSVLNAFPKAFPILCHGFADNIDWPEVADAGAFHSLPMPFSVAEVRQSLGFVWGAKQSCKPMRSRTAAKEGVPAGRVVAAGIVA
jgi:hypothetical protein